MWLMGLEDCPRCYGTGSVPQANPKCWECRGTGEVTREEAYRIEEELKKEGRPTSKWDIE